jgi:hypothetical protein
MISGDRDHTTMQPTESAIGSRRSAPVDGANRYTLISTDLGWMIAIDRDPRSSSIFRVCVEWPSRYRNALRYVGGPSLRAPI